MTLNEEIKKVCKEHGHKITWFEKNPQTREMRPRESWMRGGDFSWEAKCSCGWETHNGGAIESYVKSEIYEHKFDVLIESYKCEHNRYSSCLSGCHGDLN